MCKARIFTHFLSFLMSGFYKILANKALDESLMGALKFREFRVCDKSKTRDYVVMLRSFYNKEARANFKIS